MGHMPSPRDRGEFLHTTIITITIAMIGIVATVVLASPIVAGSAVLATSAWVVRLAAISEK